MNTQQLLKERYGIHNEYISIPNVQRIDMLDWLHELGFKTGVEVGVASAHFSRWICKKNPQMKLYGVDPWVRYDGYTDYMLKSTYERMYKNALRTAEAYANFEIIRKFSVHAVRQFKKESIDFVYIDGNHTKPYVEQDLKIWTPKIKKGGIVSGHDFTGRWPGLRKAVLDYTNKHKYQLYILGAESKRLKLKRDPSRSWIFIKT